MCIISVILEDLFFHDDNICWDGSYSKVELGLVLPISLLAFLGRRHLGSPPAPLAPFPLSAASSFLHFRLHFTAENCHIGSFKALVYTKGFKNIVSVWEDNKQLFFSQVSTFTARLAKIFRGLKSAVILEQNSMVPFSFSPWFFFFFPVWPPCLHSASFPRASGIHVRLLRRLRPPPQPRHGQPRPVRAHPVLQEPPGSVAEARFLRAMG